MSTTDPGLARTGPGGLRPPQAPAAGRRGRRWWWLGGTGALIVAIVAVLTAMASSYQPVTLGGSSGGDFPGLPAGHRLRAMDSSGVDTGDIYVPPQGDTFSLAESIWNDGRWPVTIEAISVTKHPATASDWPVVSAGESRFYRASPFPQPTPGHPVDGLSLGPGQMINVGILLRLSSACYVPHTWKSLDDFYVKERFLTFTRWVAIPLGMLLYFHLPAVPGDHNVTCPGR